MRTFYKNAVGTGSGVELDIELGMKPDKIVITNSAKRTKFVMLANDGVIGYAENIATTGASTAGTSHISWMEKDVFDGNKYVKTKKGVTLAGSAVCNIAGDTLLIEFSKFDA